MKHLPSHSETMTICNGVSNGSCQEGCFLLYLLMYERSSIIFVVISNLREIFHAE
jgi:hypothetical protein